MANSLDTNPVRIDTFGADVTITTGFAKVRSIMVNSATSVKACVFIDNDGVEIWKGYSQSGANPATAESAPSGGYTFPNGMIFDESASGLAAGDSVLINLM